MYKAFILLGTLLLSGAGRVYSQQTFHHTFQLDWLPGETLAFASAGVHPLYPSLPVYSYRIALDGPSTIFPQVEVASAEVVDVPDAGMYEEIPGDFLIGFATEQERGIWYARVWLVPLKKEPSFKALRIHTGRLSIRTEPLPGGDARSGPPFKEHSVLAEGVVHKVSVSKTGVYRLDHNFIKDKLKVDPATLSTDRIAIFGNGGGRIPQWSAAPRVDDLEQVASWGVGFDDGKFNPGDFLLWYAEGPDRWTFDPADRVYHMEKNIYDEQNHYYIVINGPQRVAMETRANVEGGQYVSDKSLIYQRLEEEKVNLLGRFRPPGSGQHWFGDEMSVVKELDYTSRFDVAGMLPDDTIHYRINFATRSGAVTRYYFRMNDREVSRNMGSVYLSEVEAAFATDGVLQGRWIIGAPITRIAVRYPDANGPDSRGWLDYIQLNYWKENIVGPGEIAFIRDPRSVYLGNPEYVAGGLSAGAHIWDVTDPFFPVRQEYSTGSKASFSVNMPSSPVPREFVCFQAAQDLPAPDYAGVVGPQNLHALHRADFIIIYYDAFEEAALKLAGHRRTFSNMEVVTVPVSQVVEEFGGGSKDPSAIRDFVRMVYTRDPSFRYLLLIGDATYDYLNRFKEIPYHNFVPTFQTAESLYPVLAFPTDDFFALLDDEEGNNLQGALDIGVGRLPVSTLEEAMAIVDKFIYYDTSPLTLQEWRQRLVMVADDEDNNVHIRGADGLATTTGQVHGAYNMHKIYLDAFPQASTPGGTRYPGVNDAIDLNVSKGALTVTYIGHGGPNGWAQERVLGINQTQLYNNRDNMPLFITATCSFASYDEPGHTSAGEHLLINPGGGAIGLMTTVRPVYSGHNERLTRAVLKFLYSPDAPGHYPPIAEVLRRAKNDNSSDTTESNARKFTLLGDPSMVLAYPRYSIGVTEIGGNPVSSGIPDTIGALGRTSVSGVILDDQGEILTGFNGKIYVTLFDKVQVRKTLANDAGSQVYTFTTQTRQLFRGAATVEAGMWSIDFVLPKDIDFNFGQGRLSLYAENGVTDAAGYFTGFIVGGVSAEGLADDDPPVIRLFMNDTLFVSGGITDRDPDIFILLSDDNGINVSGTSIGHDIEAVLDDDDKNSIVLNDFYRAYIDDYTRGEVRYPLRDLQPGLHTLKVRAWDVANNPAEAYLEFLVVDDERAILKHVLSYPNPFGDEGTRFQFEHNRADATMDIRVAIYSLSGQLVRVIGENGYSASGYRVDGIEWDGRSEAGVPLSEGMYIYKIHVTCYTNGAKEIVESQPGKLIIIR